VARRFDRRWGTFEVLVRLSPIDQLQLAADSPSGVDSSALTVRVKTEQNPKKPHGWR
jgi:hypothetical protein